MVERLSILSAVLSNCLTITSQNPFGCHKTIQSHRTSGMELTGGDPNFSSQTEPEAVCKSSGAVHKYICAVCTGSEEGGVLLILSNDCICMVGSMKIDVVYCSFKRVYSHYIALKGQVFLILVTFLHK